MLATLRSRAHSSIFAAFSCPSWLHRQTLRFPLPAFSSASASASASANSSSTAAAAAAAPPETLGFLNIEEVQKILDDVKADDIRVIPVRDRCSWTDFMVIATGRSTWHVKNIAQALIYKVKQKQIGSKRMVLPSVEGHAAGNWVVVDSGTVIVHAMDEKARAYYNLESLLTNEMSSTAPSQDVEKTVVKTRRKNNSKKPMKNVAKS